MQKSIIEAALVGISGGIVFAFLLPVAMFAAWVFVAFWIGSAFIISRRSPNLGLVLSSVSSILAAAVSVSGLSFFSAFFDEAANLEPYMLFAYLTAVGCFFSLPTSIFASRQKA